MASKIKFAPTLSIRISKLHFWLGSTKSDGRKVYGLIEQTEHYSLGFTLHWLSDESPMFALLLYPAPVAYFLWMPSWGFKEK